MSNRRPTKCRTFKVGKVNVLKVIGRMTPDENEDILFAGVKQLVDAGETGESPFQTAAGRRRELCRGGWA